ncbi:hypothetical protein AOLI_G00119990 [Acnodon oligacanthus]
MNIIKTIIILLQSLCWSQGVAGANDVIQPNIIWAEMGQSATIDCEHTKGSTYREMYWYRQHPGESMEFIVFTVSYGLKPEFGEGFDEQKFTASKTVPENGSLAVNKLDSTDSAVYFCSVREHSVTATGGGCTKTFCDCGEKWRMPIGGSVAQ